MTAGKTIATLLQDSFLVQWALDSIGISGLDHYEVEERVGSSPIWHLAKTTTQTSLIYSDKAKNNTYYYRVRAVNKAGRYSEYGNVARVVNFITTDQIISEAYNYPNPFDSRVAPATIHYLLNRDTGITMTIYDVFGNIVKKLSYSAGAIGSRWRQRSNVRDGKAGESGSKVDCGIYVCIIKSDAWAPATNNG